MEHRKAKEKFHRAMSTAHKAAASCFKKSMSKVVSDDELNDLCSIHEQMAEAHEVMAGYYAKDDVAAAAEADSLEKLFVMEAPAASVQHIPEQPQTFDADSMFGQA